MERGVERSHLRRMRQRGSGGRDAREFDGIMAGSKGLELAQSTHDGLVEADALAEPRAAMHDAVSDRMQRRRIDAEFAQATQDRTDGRSARDVQRLRLVALRGVRFERRGIVIALPVERYRGVRRAERIANRCARCDAVEDGALPAARPAVEHEDQGVRGLRTRSAVSSGKTPDPVSHFGQIFAAL